MKEIAKVLNRAEEFLISWLLLQMAITSFIQVLVRYTIGGAITWAEELLRFEIIFVVFIGAGLGVKYGSHISVDAAQRFLSKSFSNLLEIFSNFMSAGICFSLFYYSIVLIFRVKGFGQTTPVMGVPKFLLYLPFLIGSGIMGLRFLLLFSGKIRNYGSTSK